VDEIDRAIINHLAADGRMTNQDLALRVGLSAAPCLRRVRRLEESGVITGYRAVIDHAATGRAFEVLLHIDITATDLTSTEAFERRLASMPEIIEARRMFGIPDYFVRARVADAAAYEGWLTSKIMSDPSVTRVDSRLPMKTIKTWE
jgi:DNA-binding Lrp family transcriptional regulator